MPELPDLEAFSHNLTRRLKGKVVKRLEVPYKKKLTVPLSQLKKAVEQQVITRVYREGKQLRIAFKNKTILGLHMMLHGALELFEGKAYPKYTILALTFDDKTGFAMTDFQGQAMVMLNPEESEVPDALSASLNLRYLKDVLSGSKKQIKDLLMDQDKIRGIGNAYADEILYSAGISPFSIADRIPAEKVKVLSASIKKVLKAALKKILKEEKDIISGERRDFLQVHAPKKEKSPGGKPILVRKAGSRKTYYTEEQELFS